MWRVAVRRLSPGDSNPLSADQAPAAVQYTPRRAVFHPRSAYLNYLAMSPGSHRHP